MRDLWANRANQALFGHIPGVFHFAGLHWEYQETQVRTPEEYDFLGEFASLFEAANLEQGAGQLEYIWNPMHMAINSGNYRMVELFLDHGVEINMPSIGACECRHIPSFGSSITLPRPVPRPVWTPLHRAICRHRFSIAKLLLTRGASVCLEADMVDDYENALVSPPRVCTALHTACYEGCFNLVRMLVEGGYQSVTVLDRDSQTPIEYAFFGGHFKDIIPYLVRKGADINTTVRVGRVRGPLLVVACALAKYEQAMDLLKLGADVRDCHTE
ncbi:ankyrin repeat-containing domain protein [Xylariaceae sp. FL0594]|nr:ankyrin repeat-containing domain protein [Xylariaceae sp. FL0594]